MKDYVPDGLSELAEALANPIKYQNEIEKRANQLKVLTDCLEAPEEIEVWILKCCNLLVIVLITVVLFNARRTNSFTIKAY